MILGLTGGGGVGSTYEILNVQHYYSLFLKVFFFSIQYTSEDILVKDKKDNKQSETQFSLDGYEELAYKILEQLLKQEWRYPCTKK